MESNRLYRSRKDVVISGVCGGMGEHFNIDPVIVRVLWVVIGLAVAGNGILVYIIAAIVIPKEPIRVNAHKGPYADTNQETEFEPSRDEFTNQQTYSTSGKSQRHYHDPYSPVESKGRGSAGMVLGLILILAGGFLLAGNFVDLSFMYRINFGLLRQFSRFFWPVCLILLGLVFFVKSK